VTILAVNAGSSSLKYAVFGDDLTELARGEGMPQAEGIAAAGHRIVHGGTKFITPVLVDDAVMAELEALTPLAPLHMPPGLAALRRVRAMLPDVPHVACFDTAFHATQLEIETRLPLPREFFEQGYRRYGFHGLSYEHIVHALPKPLPRRVIAAHLGAGASLCAILDGKSVATTMGYSTLDGPVMATRSGSIDPGAVIAIMRDKRLGVEGMEDLLYRKSGLLGLSGLSGDMRELLASDAPEAAAAIERFCYSAARHAASLAPALGGVDAMVFTGGIGENTATIRDRILDHLAWLRPLAVHVVPANEELTIARAVRAFQLTGSAG
jgi:acetate kinase